MEISMSLKNDSGEFTKTSQVRSVHYDFELELDVISSFINNFMKSAGYFFNKDFVPMISVNEEELAYLEDCLFQYRKSKGEEGNG